MGASCRPTLLWFRNDLRLTDNPALGWAVEQGGAVIPVFIWSPQEEAPWSPGAASRWWLHQSLRALDATLRGRGLRLILRSGRVLPALKELIAETGAAAVAWNRRYEPGMAAREERVRESLRSSGIAAESFNAGLLCEPGDIWNRSGRPFRVFTPFWRACRTSMTVPAPVNPPKRIAAPATWPGSAVLASFELEPRINWVTGIRAAWQPGETGAQAQLRRFLKEGLLAYEEGRNRPDRPGTSRLSPHLRFGEIGPRQIWHAVREREKLRGGEPARSAAVYLDEIGWREFAHHLLFHFPEATRAALRPEFEKFPWRSGPVMRRQLKAWQQGRTGYPIVDAGMRELWTTGWMHNRVRMIAASFLVKDLLVDWREGAHWFWDTLVDADLANNTLGWQWTAGCGADATPYFRVFNPVLQGQKFDPQGRYVRRWVPELEKIPAKWIHRPWEAPRETLSAADVRLGATYPKPIVDHALARSRALKAFAEIRRNQAGGEQ
jgi:deoxyribodipyrimidine photo-lyase